MSILVLPPSRVFVFVSPLVLSQQRPRTVEEGCVGRFACKCAAVGSIMQSRVRRVSLVGSSQLEALEQNVMLPRLLNIHQQKEKRQILPKGKK
ncbi:hypothetical protein NOF04DRAFT_1318175 [Fusarium oxysporum II5]|nr:hypothetical protein NOF04DRAFT_1318175 [Fusarium oxysporum II5]